MFSFETLRIICFRGKAVFSEWPSGRHVLKRNIAVVALVSITLTAVAWFCMVKHDNSLRDVRAAALPSKFARWAVAEIDYQYRCGKVFLRLASCRTRLVWIPCRTGWQSSDIYGFRALGDMKNEESNLWATDWHAMDRLNATSGRGSGLAGHWHMTCVTCRWFINQMLISPLRVHDMEAADFVVVPAVFRIYHDDVLQDFMRNAPDILPLLGKKPHILVLNHPVQTMMELHPEAMSHPVILNFTLVALNNHVRGTTLPNLVGAPYFQQNHWHQGALEYRQSFDPLDVQQHKKKLAMASFGNRDGDAGKLRSSVREECTKANHLCHFVSIDNDVDIVNVFDNMRASWYTLAVPGDFVTRSMTYQTVISGSLLVVFADDYILHMPFRDVIDYSRFVSTFPYNTSDLMQQTPFIQLLQENFNENVALEQLKYMFGVRHVFQYSLNPDHKLITFAEKELLSPWDDAFTFTIKAVLRSLCKRSLLGNHRCKH